MKIIFSRKGYDSASGGIPSPIFPDGSMVSLPIPSKQSPRLKDIRYRGKGIDSIIKQLKQGVDTSESGAHLDPDLDKEARPRRAGWFPCFGQVGAAQTHLKNQNVGEGDIFLFFGWFREVVMIGDKLQYRVDAQDIHALFGWLQVGAVYNPGRDKKEPPKWASDHPHVQDAAYYSSEFNNNTLYVASKRLDMPGLTKPIAGGSTFLRFTSRLQLTEPGQNRSIWRLPGGFYPRKGALPLSYHSDMSRWQKDRKGVLLRTVGRGQEFVLDSKGYPELLDWLARIFNEIRGNCKSINKSPPPWRGRVRVGERLP